MQKKDTKKPPQRTAGLYLRSAGRSVLPEQKVSEKQSYNPRTHLGIAKHNIGRKYLLLGKNDFALFLYIELFALIPKQPAV
jgi:hypothetical protein